MKLKRSDTGELEERFFNCTYQPVRGSTGEIEGVFAHAVDVTEEVLAERRLEESERQFRSLADSIPTLAWIAEPSGSRPWFNRQWYEYTGLAEEETVGWGWMQAHDPDRIETVAAKYKEQFAKGELWEDTVRLRGRTGEYRWFLSRAIPIRNSEGRPVRWFGTSTDVTYEIEVQRRIGDAQRLESVALLAGGIAHDFNNLLVPILGYASVARETLDPDSPVQPFFSEIEQACERAATLTRQLLAYAGKTGFVITHVDVPTVVREAVEVASASIPKGVAMTVERGGAIPPVEADAGEVRQTIVSLLLNAAESIAGGHGEVRVRVGVKEIRDPSTAGFRIAGNVQPGTYVSVEVRDTGCGIDEAIQGKIFEPFFSTKFLGRGLGLAAVAGIVRTHEWGLTFRSTKGEGSTFEVFLRAVPAQHHEPALLPPPAIAESAEAVSILVIDDEEIVRRTAKLALERHGYRVLLAESGAAAVETFRNAEGAVDLVLLDMSMPRMSGQETLAALLKIDPNVKALVSSGYSEEQTLPLFSGQPTVGFIQKPYTPAELATTIQRVLSREHKTSS
jgi:PAS domain S-box-containing protein